MYKKILSVDPGDKISAVVLYNVDEKKIVFARLWKNEELLSFITYSRAFDVMIIERMNIISKKSGKEVIDTIWWAGRFCQACLCTKREFIRKSRTDVRKVFFEKVRTKKETKKKNGDYKLISKIDDSIVVKQIKEKYFDIVHNFTEKRYYVYWKLSKSKKPTPILRTISKEEAYAFHENKANKSEYEITEKETIHYILDAWLMKMNKKKNKMEKRKQDHLYQSFALTLTFLAGY